jgi:GH25 family lysozyme M1 (1,4-beta-N-acetylmuramidase)|nr:MAG TPA: PlyB like endolysin [Caudoviricetes sp.]
MATKLLDISFWQDTLDFAKIKKAGYDNIILRAGYGTTIDSKFNEYANACKKNKINIIGVYWFIYATNLTEIKANANKCLEVIKAHQPKIVFADFEYDTITKAAKKGVKLGAKECDSFTIKFCETVKKAGYIPGYYANTDYYNNMYSSAVKNKGYVFWLAHYKSDYSYHEPPIKCDFFQYTDRGTVPGLTGKKFDTNVCFSKKYLKTSNTSTITPTTNKPQGSDNNMSNNIIQNVINDAVSFAVGIANDNSHGYSQAVRSLYNITNPKSYDCSSLCCTAYYYAFLKNGLTTQANYLKSHCSYTGNMLNMLNVGFEIVARNQTAHAQMQKGDLELNVTHHVAMAIDRDNIVHARSSEGTTNTIDDSGNEIRTQGWYLYSHGWTHRLRFTGKGLNLSNIKPSQTTYNKWVGAATKDDTDVFANPTGTSKLSTYPKLNKGNLVDVIGVSGTRYQVKIADKFVGYVEKTNIKDPNAVVTKPSASTSKPAKKGYNKSEKWKGVIIAKSGLKVRKSPGTSNADLECSFSPLKYNTPVSVCDSTTGSDGNKWYYICYKGKYGFSSAKYIKKK